MTIKMISEKAQWCNIIFEIQFFGKKLIIINEGWQWKDPNVLSFVDPDDNSQKITRGWIENVNESKADYLFIKRCQILKAAWIRLFH